MQTHTHKASDKQSGSIAIRSTGDRSSTAFEFEDNRHEASVQNELRAMADGSSHVSQLRAFRNMADNSPQAVQLTTRGNISQIHQTQLKGAQSFAGEPTMVSNESVSMETGENNSPLQLKQVFGAMRELQGTAGLMHYHHLFDDTNLDSLHVTFADARGYSARTWALRTRYTQADGWADLAVEFGAPPAWARSLAESRLGEARAAALADFRTNASISALLAAARPAPTLDASMFPALTPATSAATVAAPAPATTVPAPTTSAATVAATAPATAATGGGLPWMWDEDYGMTGGGGPESDDMDYRAE
jgi:hypothetical protein